MTAAKYSSQSSQGHSRLLLVTERIRERSAETRAAYLARMAAAATAPSRQAMGCGNLAHGLAACDPSDKQALTGPAPNIAIVTAYNDMLSAHQPYADYPERLKRAIRAHGGVAQVAGGVPAMCDGITQGCAGMELSLFSRDVIALSTAVALSHAMFDGVLCLGICDKIVPGLVMGALSFGHLPVIFVPAGPMPTGMGNDEKTRLRRLHAEGKATRAQLLEAEMASYHSPGTCTFYGTANSNQVLMEIMGLHLPGASFVNPGTPLRDALTEMAAARMLDLTARGDAPTPLARVLDERAFVNGIVGLLATGGSTNHTLHLVAIAQAAGIILNWDDFSALSEVVPLLARVYPNGSADVNQFHAAGGMGFVIGQLLGAGLLHKDVETSAGPDLERYAAEAYLESGHVAWRAAPADSLAEAILAPASAPFSPDGGLRILSGSLGRAVIKTSAVASEHRSVTAPARVFTDQEQVQAAFQAGELDRDCIVVVRGQGPCANGMPELHKLTTPLSLLQGRRHKVALVTDGRMSGASGKVPAAIHVTPEAAKGGMIALVQDGDMIALNADQGLLELLISPAELAMRIPAPLDLAPNRFGTGRELFGNFRRNASDAEQGASIFTEDLLHG